MTRADTGGRATDQSDGGGTSGGGASGQAGSGGGAGAGAAGSTGSPLDGGANAGGRSDTGAAPTDAGATSDAAASRSDYKCSMLIGPNVHGDWFDAGFQAKVGDGRWQRKTPHRSFVDDWAMTGGPWSEGNCVGTWTGCTTVSRCANNAPVDRVVFVTQTGDYMTRSKDNWVKVINTALPTIKAKHPTVKHIVLMTFVRGPNGGSCGGESVIKPELDEAQAEIASKSNGEVSVGPKLMVANCNQFKGVPYVTGDGNKLLAEQAAAFFVKADGAP